MEQRSRTLRGLHYTSVANARSIEAEGFSNNHVGSYWGPGVYACLPDAHDTIEEYKSIGAYRGRSWFRMMTPYDERFEAPEGSYQTAELVVEAEVPADAVYEFSYYGDRNPEADRDELEAVVVQPARYGRDAHCCGQWVVRDASRVRLVSWREVPVEEIHGE